MRILAASVVEVNPVPRDLAGSPAVLPLALEQGGLALLDFLHLRGPVRRSPRLEPVLEQLRPQPGARAGEWLIEVSRFIHTRFEYAPQVTLASFAH